MDWMDWKIQPGVVFKFLCIKDNLQSFVQYRACGAFFLQKLREKKICTDKMPKKKRMYYWLLVSIFFKHIFVTYLELNGYFL